MHIAICVFGCITVPQYCLQISKIQETWGRRCEEQYQIPVYFFLGEEKVIGLDYPGTFRYPHRLIYMPGILNDYLSASYKQNLGIKYIMDNNPDIDFVYVCGTDTYLNIDALVKFLAFFDSTQRLCIGGHSNYFPHHEFKFDQYLKEKFQDHPIRPDAGATKGGQVCVATGRERKETCPFGSDLSEPDSVRNGDDAGRDGTCSVSSRIQSIDGDNIEFFYGGAGFVLTKAMLSELYPFLETMTDDWIANCKVKNKNDSYGTCDVCIAYYIHCLGGKYAKFYYRFFECNYRGIIDVSKRFGYPRYCICCEKFIKPHDIISCHNMSLEDSDKFTRILHEIRC